MCRSLYHTPEYKIKRFTAVLVELNVAFSSTQGVPSKSYKLPASWLKEGCAVINVSTFKNVDEEDVLKVTG